MPQYLTIPTFLWTPLNYFTRVKIPFLTTRILCLLTSYYFGVYKEDEEIESSRKEREVQNTEVCKLFYQVYPVLTSVVHWIVLPPTLWFILQGHGDRIKRIRQQVCGDTGLSQRWLVGMDVCKQMCSLGDWVSKSLFVSTNSVGRKKSRTWIFVLVPEFGCFYTTHTTRMDSGVRPLMLFHNIWFSLSFLPVVEVEEGGNEGRRLSGGSG